MAKGAPLVTTKTLHFDGDRVYEEFLPLLIGRVFHVTRRSVLDQILTSGYILANQQGQRETTFGSSRQSYFRKRGCVSVFDYRSASYQQIYNASCKCSPFRVPRANGELAYLFLSKEQHDRLLPWTEWKEEQALSDMIVPHVEAGYPGNIPIRSIEEVWRVTIAFPVEPLVRAPGRGAPSGGARGEEICEPLRVGKKGKRTMNLSGIGSLWLDGEEIQPALRYTVTVTKRGLLDRVTGRIVIDQSDAGTLISRLGPNSDLVLVLEDGRRWLCSLKSDRGDLLARGELPKAP